MAGGSTVPGWGTDDFRQWDSKPGSDRRVARGSRTRDALMDAVIQLIDAGHPTPTARQVAERTGVSVRTLYHHFGHLEALWTAAVERQLSHHRSLITAIPHRGPIGERIRILAHQRRRLFDVVGPVLRASEVRVPPSAALVDVLEHQRAILRDQVARTLAPELVVRGPEAPVVLDTLEAVTGWQHWNTLRCSFGYSAAQAERTVVFTVAQVLG